MPYLTSTTPMPSQENRQDRIDLLVAELRRRGVSSDLCPRCGTSDWEVDFFQIPAAREGFVSPLGGITGYVPVACFNCKNCGYLIYHNLLVIEKPR